MEDVTRSTDSEPPGSRFIRHIIDIPLVEDPCAAAPDLEYLAEPGEIAGFDWRLAEIGILEMYDISEMNDRQSLPGESAEEAADRWDRVRDWMKQRGGPLQALHECPVLAMIEADAVTPIDGWHRCVVAWLDYGIQNVPALVGMPKLELEEQFSI